MTDGFSGLKHEKQGREDELSKTKRDKWMEDTMEEKLEWVCLLRNVN